MKHRALSVILAVVLLLSAMPAAATAEESPEVDPIVGVWYADFEYPDTQTNWLASNIHTTRNVYICTFDPSGYVFFGWMNYTVYSKLQKGTRPAYVGHWEKTDEGVYYIMDSPSPDYVNMKPARLIDGDLYLHIFKSQYVKFHKMIQVEAGEAILDTDMPPLGPQGE